MIVRWFRSRVVISFPTATEPRTPAPDVRKKRAKGRQHYALDAAGPGSELVLDPGHHAKLRAFLRETDSVDPLQPRADQIAPIE
jgi:hypothetical protein